MLRTLTHRLGGVAIRQGRQCRSLSTAKEDLMPPMVVAVTGAAGQIGYATVMRIAR